MEDFDSLVDDSQKTAEPAAAPQEPQKPLMFDDLKEDAPKGEPAGIKFDDLQDDSEKYSTPMQQIGAAAEGVAQGVAGPLATAAELGLGKMGVPGMSAEEISARSAANPTTHSVGEAVGLVGSMFLGTGEAGLIAKGLEHIPQGTTALAKIGSHAIKGMIQMGLIEGGDEISKAMLGQGDPETPVSSALAHMGAAALLGAATGGASKAIGLGTNKGLKLLEDTKAGNKLKSFLAGFGHAIEGNPLIDAEAFDKAAHVDGNMNWQWFKKGANAGNPSVLAKRGTQGVGVAVGEHFGGLGAFIGSSIGKALSPYFESTVTRAGKYASPTLLKIFSSGVFDGITDALDHAAQVSSGKRMVSKGVDALFKAGPNEALDYEFNEKHREKLRNFIESGGIDNQLRDEQAQEQQGFHGFSSGGEVQGRQANASKPLLTQPNGLAVHYPEQNMLLNTAKARISNYLTAMKPQKTQASLPFDTPHEDKQKHAEYNKLLDLANQPLSILKHVKQGSLLPSHMKAFTQMYPELYTHLSKKITERMGKHNLNEETKPPYHVRQAMSLFLGAPLDSTMTPMSIQAAQNAFVVQKSQGQAPKSNASLSKMGQNAMTPEQSRTQRLNKS